MMETTKLENDESNEVRMLEKETVQLDINKSINTNNDLNSQAEKIDKVSDASSHLTHSSMSVCSSAAGRGATKVYYHIDDEQTPYCTELPVPNNRVTLGDFKRVLNRTNFKYYCKAIDSEVGGEVKAEIRDDAQQLTRSSNGHFELFLLTAENSNSDGNSSGVSKLASMKKVPLGPTALYPFTSSQHYRPRNRCNHTRQPFDDSTLYTNETDHRLYSDDESRLSTSTDNITSVSRQRYNLYRRRRRQAPRNRRKPSRASSLSSMTETSMALEVITVTLNMDSAVNFLGISIVGQSSSRGDNGIYVANVIKGGAVALDGRIEPGDMILQVNDVSFENFKNDKAVEVLKQAVNRQGPIKLTVAKSFDSGRANYFSVPVREPVRPIGSEGAPTPIPAHNQYHPHEQMVNMLNIPTSIAQHQQRSACSSNTTATSTNGSGGVAPQIVLGQGGVFLAVQPRLDINSDKRMIIRAMIAIGSGLEIRDRTWLKIPIPMSFLGSSLVDWLIQNVDGLKTRKEARKYASDLLKERFIAHVVNKQVFTEQCYYVFGDNCSDLLLLRNGIEHGSVLVRNPQNQALLANQRFLNDRDCGTQVPYMLHTNFGGSEYAMPSVSPYPPPGIPLQTTLEYSTQQRQLHKLVPQNPVHTQTRFDQFGANSQASNNSNEESSGSEHRRKAMLPPAPSLTSIGQPQYFQPHQFFQGQIHRTSQPTGPPPTTPDDVNSMMLNRFCGINGTFQQQVMSQQNGRVGVATENFFVEHF
ncbi:unnamed protein product [Meloidogyne enterolobii]|uniref:Uncharacterized protein n=1 Tax=Meloidogyne enterolobii TaxID=390850 RepID=A0ACB1A2D1_MELEN